MHILAHGLAGRIEQTNTWIPSIIYALCDRFLPRGEVQGLPANSGTETTRTCPNIGVVWPPLVTLPYIRIVCTALTVACKGVQIDGGELVKIVHMQHAANNWAGHTRRTTILHR